MFQYIYKQINAEKSLFYAWFEAMHTRVDIAICNLSEIDSKIRTEKIRTEIFRIEKFSDRFNPETEISLINCSAGNNPIPISRELFAIIEDCISYNKKTQGAFDITIQSKNNYRNGIGNIILNSTEKTIFFKNENIRIDLCGYIKGYVLDKIKFILLESNCTDALISMGNSSVLALGNHPDGKGWKVNLPGKENKTQTLFDECLTTSGNTKGHFHIVNPDSGEEVKSTQIVSVVTKNGTEGEVLSIASCITNIIVKLSRTNQHQFWLKELNC